MTSQDSALTRFRRALAVGNGPAAYAAATELPRVELADALALTLLLSDQPELFERACVRWVGRFSLEVPDLPLESAHLTLSALSSLRRGSAAGGHALAELCEEVGRSDLTEVAERWMARADHRCSDPRCARGDPVRDGDGCGELRRRALPR